MPKKAAKVKERQPFISFGTFGPKHDFFSSFSALNLSKLATFDSVKPPDIVDET